MFVLPCLWNPLNFCDEWFAVGRLWRGRVCGRRELRLWPCSLFKPVLMSQCPTRTNDRAAFGICPVKIGIPLDICWGYVEYAIFQWFTCVKLIVSVLMCSRHFVVCTSCVSLAVVSTVIERVCAGDAREKRRMVLVSLQLKPKAAGRMYALRVRAVAPLPLLIHSRPPYIVVDTFGVEEIDRAPFPGSPGIEPGDRRK